MSTNRKLLSFQERKEAEMQMKQDRLDKRLQDVHTNQSLINQEAQKKNLLLANKLENQSIRTEMSQRKQLADLEAKFAYEQERRDIIDKNQKNRNKKR